MRCEEVQDLASAWLDNELSDGRAAMVAEHVTQCDACRNHVADLRLLSAQMRRFGREPAPAGLEDRIRSALAQEQGQSVVPFVRPSRWQGFTRQLASMAAVCLLSVFGTWAVVRQPAEVVTTQHDVVAAHVRSLLQNSPIQVPSSDSHTVRPWFNGKVEFAPPVRDLTAEGFPLIGGRLDFIDGHRVATLVYRHSLHTISVFVWPEGADQRTGQQAGPGGTPGGNRPAASGAGQAPGAGQGAAKLLSQVNGLNVLSWTKDGMVWWAVSDMEASEMRELRTLL